MQARRSFLHGAARAIASLVSLSATASVVEALPVAFVAGQLGRDEERIYRIPATDGVDIDKGESVVIARFQNVVYAFSLACPHQNTALRWDGGDHQFQCPKHHSRYRPDGAFIDGRATRGMDRFGVRRDGDRVAVDLDKLYQEDKDAAEWRAAFVTL